MFVKAPGQQFVNEQEVAAILIFLTEACTCSQFQFAGITKIRNESTTANAQLAFWCFTRALFPNRFIGSRNIHSRKTFGTNSVVYLQIHL